MMSRILFENNVKGFQYRKEMETFKNAHGPHIYCHQTESVANSFEIFLEIIKFSPLRDKNKNHLVLNPIIKLDNFHNHTLSYGPSFDFFFQHYNIHYLLYKVYVEFSFFA